LDSRAALQKMAKSASKEEKVVKAKLFALRDLLIYQILLRYRKCCDYSFL
jgi:hypothetical protein